MKKLIQLAALLLIITSCEFNVNVGGEENEVDFGPMPVVENKTFEKIYIVNEDVCAQKKLPPTRFAIEFPNELDVKLPDNERDHINLKRWENGIITEEISIGNSTITAANKNLATPLLEQLVAEFKKQIPELQIDFIGQKKFKGEMAHMFQGHVELIGVEDQGYAGNYFMMGMVPLPKEQEDMNAILVTFVAQENSQIQSYQDFENAGMIGEVWNTFRYLE
ncbi:MAG: hypothetical protein N4A46_00835 [Schleiferiaceae bacterium]|jgi:hypothetical protein|nr:hypothetical protein [Schleiferiaceae bacterium]